ncbi:hypothetical protein ACSVH2_02210 [Flavobacterium sp. RSB2_4_14]|uniref:hypothetical protein n=1 Tax=Flavobacterium sp. RSB2_4_14 TaxID=3447665 RepID=UPI003F2E38B6
MIRANFFILFFLTSSTFAQNKDEKLILLSEIKLCELKLSDLKKQDENLKEVEVVEMDLCSDGFVEDSRFENRKGYVSSLYPNVIFQKDSYGYYISKIRLTKEFKGYLPDGTYININELTAKIVIEKYSKLDTWISRGCSDFWSLNDDKIYFYVAIDKSKEPRYPIDKAYYITKKIEGVDIVSNCYKYLKEKEDSPLYVIDGKEVNKEELKKFNAEDIETVTVLKESAVEKYGEKGKNGVIIIVTKASINKK